MTEDLEILKQYVESLGLESKSELRDEDVLSLASALDDGDETALAGYVKPLKAADLQDLIVNTLYG